MVSETVKRSETFLTESTCEAINAVRSEALRGSWEQLDTQELPNLELLGGSGSSRELWGALGAPGNSWEGPKYLKKLN